MHESWLHWIHHESSSFAGGSAPSTASDSARPSLYDVHVFKVVWSTPTRRSPVPSTTAHVYFTFKCSTVKPKVGLAGGGGGRRDVLLDDKATS